MASRLKFFEMTRRERRGSIVVLVVIALLLAVQVAMRSCEKDVVATPQETQAVDFDAAADSTKTTVKSIKTAHKKAASQGKAKKKKQRSKPEPQPRRMDPVPAF